MEKLTNMNHWDSSEYEQGFGSDTSLVYAADHIQRALDEQRRRESLHSEAEGDKEWEYNRDITKRLEEAKDKVWETLEQINPEYEGKHRVNA